ncbi:hypothetical protein GGI42DRAFT_337636 [Trichoderma sp. SZMC 28013]
MCEYHGRKATLPKHVDRNALCHHYEMCCIENMIADMPLVDQLSEPETEMPRSGTAPPFTTRGILASISPSIDTRRLTHCTPELINSLRSALLVIQQKERGLEMIVRTMV